MNDSTFGNVFVVAVFYLIFYRTSYQKFNTLAVILCSLFVIALFNVCVKFPLAWVTSPVRVDAEYLASELPVNLKLFG